MSKSNKKENRADRMINGLRSTKFTVGIMAFFAFEAIWIALSGAYPMAFDEFTHFGIIKIYAHQWLPFFAHQPNGANDFGAVVRDPSYLYHYLMSFPYRIFAHFVSSQYAQVLFLRFLNIGIFILAMIVFYKVLCFSNKLSRGVVNGVFLFFVLTPVVPLVAAQINYDSLFFLGTAISILLTQKLGKNITTSTSVDFALVVKFLIACLLASIVKYAFLPIFLAESIVVLCAIHKRRKIKSSFLTEVRKDLARYTFLKKTGLVLLVLVSFTLFFERYGLNVIHYETPIPQCNQVLSINVCESYGLWARNYELANTYAHIPHGSLVSIINVFKSTWIRGMLQGLFYTNGPGSLSAAPLLMPRIAEYAVLTITVLLFIRSFDNIYKFDKMNGTLLFISLAYLAVLCGQNFLDFKHTGVGVGIQGRYLLPVLLPIYVVGVQLISYTLKTRQTLKLVVFSVLLVCMLEGGGALTFILQSDANWYWPNSLMTKANEKAQAVLAPVIVK